MSYVISDTYTYDSSAADSQVLSLTSKSFSSDEDAIKSVVQAYFVLRYEFLKNPTQETFALVAASDDPDAIEWLRHENSRQNIERYNAELFNTKFLDYKFTLDYTDLEIDSSKAVVRLLESHWVRYASTPDFISHLVNMEHIITLNKVGERWLIVEDAYPEDLINRALETMTEEEILDNIRRNYEKQFLEPSGTESEMTTIPANSADSMFATYSYNRTAAKNYADNWYSATGPVPSHIKNQPG